MELGDRAMAGVAVGAGERGHIWEWRLEAEPRPGARSGAAARCLELSQGWGPERGWGWGWEQSWPGAEPQMSWGRERGHGPAARSGAGATAGAREQNRSHSCSPVLGAGPE